MANGNGAAPQEQIKELQQKIVEKRDQAYGLIAPYQGKAVPAEVETQFKAIIGEVDGIKSHIESYKRLEDIDKVIAAPASEPTWRPSVTNEGGELPVDSKSWRTYQVKNFNGQVEEKRFIAPLAVYANTKGLKGTGGKLLSDTQYERAYVDGFDVYQRKGMAHLRENYPIEAKALSEGSDSAGGFTVPVDFQSQMIMKSAAYATIRPMATVIQTSRDVVVFPRIPYTATATDDSGNKRFTSAVRMTWGGENPATSTTARVTDQTIGQVEVKVNTAISSQLVSNDLLEDNAVDLATYLIDNTGEAFALGENAAFITGTGVAQPTGLITSAQLGTIGNTVSGTNADITTSGDSFSGLRIVQMFYALPAQYRRNASFLVSSKTMQQIESLVDGNKRPLISSLIGGANIGIGTPDMIKGRPVLVEEFMQDYDTTGNYPILIGDFKGYTIVDRVQFSIQRYTELYVETNFTLFLARKRVGGLVTHPWKFNFMKAST